MTEHLKLAVCCYSRLSEADISTMCQQSHICDSESTKCQTAAIDCHVFSSSTLSPAAKVVSAVLLLSLTCHLLVTSQHTL